MKTIGNTLLIIVAIALALAYHTDPLPASPALVPSPLTPLAPEVDPVPPPPAVPAPGASTPTSFFPEKDARIKELESEVARLYKENLSLTEQLQEAKNSLPVAEIPLPRYEPAQAECGPNGCPGVVTSRVVATREFVQSRPRLFNGRFRNR